MIIKQNFDRFLIDFASQKEPKIEQKRRKIDPESHPTTMQPKKHEKQQNGRHRRTSNAPTKTTSKQKTGKKMKTRNDYKIEQTNTIC